MPLRFFTICSNNYLAHAITVGRQLERFHPHSEFTIFLTDRQIGYEQRLVPYRVVLIERLGLVDELGMIKRYNITELNTAIKPSCFRYLFNEGKDPAVYLDPDVLVVSELAEVEDELTKADAVLTPHILRPSAEHSYPPENFLRLGMYNLGFLALRPADDTNDFLRWWAERLETDCVIDTPRGVFVDQKWADFLPSFVDRCKVLRHPGYNVAYWNINNRKLVESDKGLLANGQPLRFVHFSGLPADGDSTAISNQMSDLTSTNAPTLGRLAKQYRLLLEQNGHSTFQSAKFSYFVSPRAERNEHRPDLFSTEDATGGRLSNYFLLRSFRDQADYQQFETSNSTALRNRETREASVRSSLAAGATMHVVNPVDNNQTRLRFDSDTWPELYSETGMSSQIRALAHVFLQELSPEPDADISVQEDTSELSSLLARRFAHLHDPTTAGLSSRDIQFVLDPRTPTSESVSFAIRDLTPGGFFLTTAQGDATWEKLSAMEAHGFENLLALNVWSDRFGYLGRERFVLLGQKPHD